jgi:hypothetical protein
MSKGMKLNNPGNIRTSRVIYVGENVSLSLEFKSFKTLDYGIRALLSLLSHYIRHDKLTTIKAIITKYAPENDGNNTKIYIQNVSIWTGFRSDQPLAYERDTIIKLAYAIIKQEQSIEIKYETMIKLWDTL